MQHQIEDAAFLASMRVSGCFNGMGTGKTRTALEACKARNSAKILVVAPPIALTMWAQEAADHLGMPVKILRKGSDRFDSMAGIHVTTYSLATSGAKALAEYGFDAMVLDESHALKSLESARTKAIIGNGGLCESVDQTFFLTGTPTTRWSDDLYPFILRAGPERLRADVGGLSIERFRLKYCITQMKTYPGMRRPKQVTVGSRNEEALRTLLFEGEGRLATRRLLADVVANMPPVTQTTLTVDMAMNAELKKMLDDLDKVGSKRGLEALVETDDPALATVRRHIGMAKVPAAAQAIAERVDAGERPLLVFAWHTDVISHLADALRAFKVGNVATLDGSTSPKRRDAIVEDFNAQRLDVLIGQTRAMGVSLNLQKGGSRCIFVERDWSPAIMDQAIARLWRMGQDKHVHVDYYDADTPLDAAVRALLAKKMTTHKTIMGDK
jgi:SWI/SNF-related matrix-associated actin-dependent regulator 1 of chromatin subfamily A